MAHVHYHLIAAWPLSDAVSSQAWGLTPTSAAFLCIFESLPSWPSHWLPQSQMHSKTSSQSFELRVTHVSADWDLGDHRVELTPVANGMDEAICPRTAQEGLTWGTIVTSGGWKCGLSQTGWGSAQSQTRALFPFLPQFPHWQNGDNRTIYLLGCLWRLNEFICVTPLEPSYSCLLNEWIKSN